MKAQHTTQRCHLDGILAGGIGRRWSDGQLRRIPVSLWGAVWEGAE
jgi:hypothetical protein